MELKKYNIVVSGGTFDYLHKGHKDFLRYQLALSKKVLIGLTTNAYAKQKGNVNIEPFDARKKALLEFLKHEDALEIVEIEAIDSVYIPSVWEQYTIDAIVVTADSKNGAETINNRREKEGLQKLPIVAYTLILASDHLPISSSRIREGQIDREGKVFIKPEWLQKQLILEEQVRALLTKPFGVLITDFASWFHTHKSILNPHSVVTVGDVVTDTFNTYQFRQKISVIDLKVARKPYFSNVAEHKFGGDEQFSFLTNQPGTLNPQLFQSIKTVKGNLNSNKNFVIVVDGEEDLAVLPLLLFLPLKFLIFYGQPGVGVVQVSVTEESKNKAYSIVSSFKS